MEGRRSFEGEGEDGRERFRADGEEEQKFGFRRMYDLSGEGEERV